ncbi:Polyamine-transporting ATPase 13A3 [Halotydeus destructor]|nr:Polyamine-transporting ATPase 13A3 [Halotydeus destructor]
MNKFGNKRKPSAYEQINVGEPDLMVIEGFKSNLVRTVLFWTSVTLSLGIVYIVTDWKKSLYLKCTHEKCPLDSSETVLLTDESGQEFAEQIVRPSPLVTTLTDHVYFMHKQIKYIWRPEQGTFSKLHGLDNEKCSKIYTHSQGLSSKEAEMAAILYGSNSIVVDVKPMWKLVMEEIRSPFYVYQLFIVLVWLVQLYYQFAICIFLFSVGSVSIQVYETRKQSLLLREKVQSESEVCLVRDDDIMTKPSTDLVPGDVIILPVGSTYQMECDAILISGNCTVDESMLTGESVPITKVSLAESPSVLYSNSKHKNNTLFCGTCVLYVQPTEDAHVKAIVLRTGYSTAKGELVRSILYPKNVNQQLRRDIIKCMVTFLFLGIPCMVYTGRVFSALNARLADTVIIVIDVATFLCPPLLPAVMTSINAHAQKRLRNRGIFCLNSSFINFAGGLDVVVFDKTGTLTEDTIDYQKAVVVDRGEFKMAAGPVEPDSPEKYHLFLTMACCHSLVEYNGTYHGDSLDLKMFEALKWSFKGSNDEGLFERPPDRIVGPREMGENSSLYGIVRQFPFESVLQRMSCVCIKQGSPMYKVLLKGAPEKVVSFCDPSTVPRDWETVLESYARDGLRVIAAAHRVLEDGDLKTILHMPREDLETEMTFDGFLIFANRLKDETGPALAELRSVDIRTIMATGDNMLTAVSVARNCGMIGEHDSVIQVEANVHTKPGLRPSECEQLVVKYKYAKLPGLSEQIKMNVKSDLIDEALIPMVDTIDSKSYHLCADGASFEAIRLCRHSAV